MLGSGGVVVIDDQTCMVKFALRIDEVLSARELRLVHSLPRRHGLVEENADSRFHAGGGVKQGHRQHSVPVGKHAGTHFLSARAMPRPCRRLPS